MHVRLARPITAAALAFLAFGWNGPALALQSPPVAEPAGKHTTELAEILLPEQAIIDIATKSGRATFDQALATDPNMKAAEKAYPGLAQHVWSKVSAEIPGYIRDTLPKMRVEMAAELGPTVKPAEAAALVTFYRSPTGRKLMRAMYGGFDHAPIAGEIAADPTAPISREAFQATQKPALDAIPDVLSKEDEPALIELGRAVPLARLRELGQVSQRIGFKFVNQRDPALEKRMERIGIAAAQEFISQSTGK